MKVLIIGSTGLVGSSVLQLLMTDSDCEKIISVSRRKGPQYPKILEINMEFSKLESLKNEFNNQFDETDIAICCLGTTIKTAGSENAFRQVDYEYVVQFAKICKTLGIERFGVISAVGASLNSNIFYSKIKGEMEEALISLNFKHLVIAHPGLLLGDRKEFRLAEKIFILASPFLNALLVGPFVKYRSVHADQVAQSLVMNLKNANQKIKYLEGLELLSI